MDLLLTHGYSLSGDSHERAVMKPYPPLGILYLSSHLKARGFDVAVADPTFSTEEEFRALVARERPAVVGITANLMTRKNALPMIRACKEAGATVVLGGPEPVNYAEEYLTRGADVVVAGEGELTLEELLPHLVRRGAHGMQHIAGIVYREDDGALVRTGPRPFIQNLDAQPFPDREAIDLRRYLDAWRQRHGMGSVSLLTARGCAYTCTWCSRSVFGSTHRRRSPGNVAEELEQIVAAYRPEMVWYTDDVFTLSHKWLSEYSSELERRGLKVPFETISREDRLNEDVIRTLAKMGCSRLWVGAESGSQRILDAMKRRTDAKRVREVVRSLTHHGISAGMFVMLGYEGEEIEDIEATVELLRDARPDLFLTALAYPVKGTPYYDEVAARIVPLKAWEDGSDRDVAVTGRHSRRFYSFATRWMVNEVNWRKGQGEARGRLLRRAKSFLNARVGRLGMRITRGEVEGGRKTARRARSDREA